MNYLDQANQIKETIIADRRAIHQFAELGFDLPQTTDYLCQRLAQMGITASIIGKGAITCTIGKKEGKTILLRGDIDALPMQEESGVSYQAQNGNCHSCGHDCHGAMLLNAAYLLKQNEENLQGKIKLLFQPAEELLAGANDAIANGILQNPTVDAALGLHIDVANENAHSGQISYALGPALFSGDAVQITVYGSDAHGSTPEKGVDAITIASHIVLALQEILAREVSCFEQAMVLVGKISGGTTCNTVAGSATLECSIRATTPDMRAFLKQRVEEISKLTAQTFRGSAQVDFVYGIAPLVTDQTVGKLMADYTKELIGGDKVIQVGPRCGTEDFTAIAQNVPAAFMFLGVGSPAEGYTVGAHNPAMIINEDALTVGTAIYAHCASEYLKNNQ